MKKTKAVSVLLIASLMMSMTGCSGAKKQVIAAADEYAKAILAADAGDIADLMKDSDEAEEALEQFFGRYTSNEDIAEVYDFILENTTYKIDKKSVEVKDKKASATIVFTMIDYMDVYDELDDDDADAEDFLDALEDATDNTCEVDLKVSFKLNKDEWLVDDKDNEDLMEFYELYTDIAELGLGGLAKISASDFEEVLLGCSDLDEDDIDSYDGSMYSYVTYYYDDYCIICYEFEDADEAHDYFDDTYEDYLDMIDDGDFEGNHSAYIDDTCGYILMDGETFTYDFYDDDVYGGIYQTDNVYVIIITTSHDQSKENTIDQILNAIGYPKP